MEMTKQYDAFRDVEQEQFGGSLVGAGIQEGWGAHRTVHAQPQREGLIFQFECSICGTITLLQAEWPEMVALKYGVNPTVAFRQLPNLLKEPTDWAFQKNENGEAGWRPDVKCTSCPAKLDLLIEPHEPERYLAAARRAGFINPQGEQQISQICSQIAAQAGNGGRR